MVRLKLVFFVLVVLFIGCDKTDNQGRDEQKLNILKKIPLQTSIVKNPWRMLIYNNHLYLIDPESENTVLHFDTSGVFINSFGPMGQGPGELSFGSNFSGIAGNYLFIAEWTRLNIFKFPEDTFIKQIDKKGSGRPIYVYKNWVLTHKVNPTSFLLGFRIDENYTVSYADTLFLGKYSENIELMPCKMNPLLKQGSVYSDGANIFFSLYDASIVMGFNEKAETIFKTMLPYNIPIPEVIRYGNADYFSPPRNKYPEVNIAISGDEKYLYTVYSGTILKSQKDVLSNVADLGQGEILNVYDKHTSEFLGSYQLPYPVRDIVATQSCIYALSVDPEVAVYKLKKPLESVK